MQIRILGSAAGGGFPQWNCHCGNCRAARRGEAAPRLQSSVAIRRDAASTWHLVNASPDAARQIERFLSPGSGDEARRSPLASVYLTNADLDHCLGLFQLREGPPISITAPRAARQALSSGLNLDRVLGSFSGLQWQPFPEDWTRVEGLETRGIPLRHTAPPRYNASASASSDAGSHSTGYLFRDPASGKIAAILPDVALLDALLLETLRSADLVLFDGTFWTNDEMPRLGFTTRDAAAMGHVPISGPDGSLAKLAALPARCIYLHINNTNPLLLPASPERQAVIDAGLEIAEDGMTFDL